MFHSVSSIQHTLIAGIFVTGFMALAPIAAARAETIPFNQVILGSTNPEGDQYNAQYGFHSYSIRTSNSDPASLAAEEYAKAGTWGSVQASGSADLANGRLKLQVGAAANDDSTMPSVRANAIFGDGFRSSTPDGQPFAWTSDSQAQFVLDLTGMMTISGEMTAAFHPGVYVILSILAPGTLDPDGPLINGPTALDYFFWSIGDPNPDVYYEDRDHNITRLVPTESYDALPIDALTANFTPGGDFDWVLVLAGAGQVTEAGQSFNYDLSHTLELAYNGPDGTVTRTVSGQFGGYDQVAPDPIAQVAEPGTLLALLSALGIFAFARRRGRAQRGSNRFAAA